MKYIEQLRQEVDAKYFKSVLLEKLHNYGIPESDINIRIASEKTSNNKKHVLGFYRQNSQFHSESPYMSISMDNTYRALLDYDLLWEEESYEKAKKQVLSNMLDTACHEYGHVIEEYLHFVYKMEPNDPEVARVFKLFKEKFIDNEDFAEQFGLLIAKNDFYSDEESLKEVYDFYSKRVFPEAAFEWIKQPKDEKDMAYLIDTTKSFEKWNVVTDEMAGQSMDVCKDIVKILKAKYKDLLNIEIVKVSDPKDCSKFPLADIQFDHYSHNLVKVTTNYGVKYLDFLMEQTGNKLFQTEVEILENWGRIHTQEPKVSKRKKLSV